MRNRLILSMVICAIFLLSAAGSYASTEPVSKKATTATSTVDNNDKTSGQNTVKDCCPSQQQKAKACCPGGTQTQKDSKCADKSKCVTKKDCQTRDAKCVPISPEECKKLK